MKFRITTLAATSLLFAMSASPSFADEALATAKGCMACHKVDTKVVGPAYKDVAAKYKGDAGAVDALASSGRPLRHR